MQHTLLSPESRRNPVDQPEKGSSREMGRDSRRPSTSRLPVTGGDAELRYLGGKRRLWHAPARAPPAKRPLRPARCRRLWSAAAKGLRPRGAAGTIGYGWRGTGRRGPSRNIRTRSPRNTQGGSRQPRQSVEITPRPGAHTRHQRTVTGSRNGACTGSTRHCPTCASAAGHVL